MLRGRFGDTSKRPYLEGRLLIPRLRVWSDISFLVDTGADKTTLLPADSLKMGLDYNTLTKSSDPAIGIGGISHNYTERSIVLFNEPGKALHAYEIELEIVESNDELMGIPSLLGRDVLNRWQMNYSPTTDELTFQVLSSDRTIPLQV